MIELDRASLDRTLPPRSGSADWNEVLRVAGAGRQRRGRRLAGIVAALLVLVVGTASAFGTVRALFASDQHVERNNFAIEGKRGSFSVRILSTRPRTWRLVTQFSPAPDVSSTVAPTGQYVQVTGRGRVVRIGGHVQSWSARLVGFVSRPGEAKQRIVITMKGRPEGVLVLTPLEPGVLKRDSGTLIYTYASG